ncbi:unnamed protein product [Rotaria sordida]|uniref:Uncharacterized protein n=1 Tax=Rotaria sordida TaxID=392033 RepID=A0A814EWD5_9BILA|nr:unnamed protein product [Rotaria sordida]CAF0961071.1 unnamed protein product [Rotaria sordida]CAF0974918.1 unnamed protein product [Rotaria sordida]
MSSTGSDLSTSGIIGIVVGGVFTIVSIIGIIVALCALCGKKNNPTQVQPYHPYPNSQNPYGQPMAQGYYPQQQAWNSQSMTYIENPSYSSSKTNY